MPARVQIKDDELVRLKRVVGFLKQHADLLSQAVDAGDINTADFLAGVVLNAATEISKTVKKLLEGGTIV